MKTIAEKLQNYTVNNNGCWIWNGGKTDRKYGITTINKERIRVHRLMWSVINGKIPIGMCICHKCDNPSCINPDHLFLGTNQDNVNDREKKGRNKPPIVYGENNPRAKLKEADVIEILKLINKNVPLSNIAKMYNVGATAIFNIKHGIRWTRIQRK
jgi:hypothetical protein